MQVDAQPQTSTIHHGCLLLVACRFDGEQFPPKVKKKPLLIIPDWQADEFASELYFRLSVILPLMYVEEGQLLSRKIRDLYESDVSYLVFRSEYRYLRRSDPHYFCHPNI